MTGDQVIEALSGHRFRFSTERDLQDGVAKVLDAAGIVFKKEHRLDDKGIIDFWIPEGRVGIECKIKGTLPDVTRQLFRYSESDQVDVLVLVTSRSKLGELPEEMNGVGIWVKPLWKTFL